ncbi:Irc10p DI49_2387 [Saccharomyces eubayanus]|uniref:Irc10p n=1 Tax=Saccharomyces eubayanus TaxID=1080349 RepID=UPI0006C0BB69|nr:hypothetical protein DI49_2387 [Saccharomyces eubayanus]KOG99052.1 hypothetical protein DI49_2387 [Saccharomyces eubayanus]
MFIEYSRLPGFESINASFSRGMLRLAKFTNFATNEEKLEYLKLLAGPNKHVQRISVKDFKENPDEINYIYIMLISILQMEECLTVLVQCPTVYWIRFGWPGKQAVSTVNSANQTLASAFHAVFTPYFSIMKKVMAKIKDNMLLFAQPYANSNNLFIKHFHDLIFKNSKEEAASDTILYLRNNVNIPNVFFSNRKAVFHGDRVKIGKFDGQFLSFSFKRKVSWSKLDSVDSFEITAVNYRVLVNWEKTPRKIFLPLNSDTSNLRYISKTTLNGEEGNLIKEKTGKPLHKDENACTNESPSIEFPVTTSAKTEYLLKSDFSLQRINKSRDPTLQELMLNKAHLSREDTFYAENMSKRKHCSSDAVAHANKCDSVPMLVQKKNTTDLPLSVIEPLNPSATSNREVVLGETKYQPSVNTKNEASGAEKIVSRRRANWISSNPAPDPYRKASMSKSIFCPSFKDVSEIAPSKRIKSASPNYTPDLEQSPRSLIIKSKSKPFQKHNISLSTCGRFRNKLTKGAFKIKSCYHNLDADVHRNKGNNLLQKRLILQDKTRKKFEQFRNDLQRVSQALRAARKSWEEHGSHNPIY